MLLEDKSAVIYGGGGKVGAAFARAFAREGARVSLAGRTLEGLEEVAEEIRSAGGAAETAQVDALDERAVDEHADAVAERAGSIDVSINLISYADLQGTPLAEMPLEDFERPVVTAVRTQFLTSRAAARHMVRQGSGVILTFGGAGATPFATTPAAVSRSTSAASRLLWARSTSCAASWPRSSGRTAFAS
jgi:3-oxoacyl-[acyl-carrier protein] reductase